MHDELISSLRICGKINSANDNCIAFHDGSCEAEPVCMYELMDNAADAIEELQLYADLYKDLTEKGEKVAREVIDKHPKWIPVTERLPRDRQFVLAYCGDNKRIRPSDRFDVAILLGDSIFTSLGVTHWMPLPSAPMEE